MTDRAKLYELVGRAVADGTFGAAVAADPVKAAKEAGVNLSQNEIDWLKSNPQQWQSFLKIVKRPGVAILDCHTCIVDGH